ncbi:tRNA dimethylallyltransferase 9-like [Lolium rigidum]|uniref:tRNA dimethylallyltransferase 9-like n=1 Tax=Lolium rigidum TaxID=89674 RepID=UPI001F5C1631|nr:tRNA dimethylallyltransferase 9-like [Lolium rigidum]
MCCEMRPRFGFGSTARRRIWPALCSSAKKLHVAVPPAPLVARKKSKVIVISGPTGAGKSRLALEVARRLGGEIVSADSVQVYRGLDIGSAKPSVEERSLVPHHLIDIMHPSEDYSAGTFFDDARGATQDVLDRGRVPVVAGGTGLYLRWFMYGKPDVPRSSVEISSSVRSELAGLRWEDAVELVLQAGDPKARDLDTNNWVRLSRRLEIIRSSGSPPSAFALPYSSFQEQQHGTKLTDSPMDCQVKELDYDFLCIFLACPRVELYRSIDLRCEEMLADTGRGLLSEASWLLDIGLQPNMDSASRAMGYSASRAIGYRQTMEYLLQCRENGGNSSPQEFLEFLAKFQQTSRNFSKRQMTWFRNEKIYQWVDASQPFEAIVQFICDAYNGVEEMVVPESLEMKRESCVHKSNDLKTYRSENRLFLGEEDCRQVLDWIRRTQGK